MFYALFDIITIGFPFCAFKIIAGIHYELKGLVALGVIDIVFNTINLFVLLTKKKKVDSCLLSFATRKIFKSKDIHKSKWQDLGEAFDVALSFIIVAFVIGSGDIAQVDQQYILYWNWAVVFNVLGAGSARVLVSLKSILKEKN